MNRKRKEGESYKQYRENLKAENEALKQRLEGKYSHVSKGFTITGGNITGTTQGVTYEKEAN